LTVAIESSADFIATVPSLLVLIQDETCRYLFSLLSSEKLSVLAAACRLCFLLFEAMRTRLKFQMELYVTKLMEIVVHESPKMAFERRLVALEAIAQLCRIPGIFYAFTLKIFQKTKIVLLHRIGYGIVPQL
jgi:golgi-specific brefeldin A-resistance guanine nucleotide exchange factor 1